MNMNQTFEKWLLSNFGDDVQTVLSETQYDAQTGYSDEYINAIFLGFNGGVQTAIGATQKHPSGSVGK